MRDERNPDEYARRGGDSAATVREWEAPLMVHTREWANRQFATTERERRALDKIRLLCDLIEGYEVALRRIGAMQVGSSQAVVAAREALGGRF